MKKLNVLLGILTLFTIFACSNDDDNSECAINEIIEPTNFGIMEDEMITQYTINVESTMQNNAYRFDFESKNSNELSRTYWTRNIPRIIDDNLERYFFSCLITYQPNESNFKCIKNWLVEKYGEPDFISENNPNIQIVYPVHLNPKVQEPVNRLLSELRNVFLIKPQEYLPFVYLMDSAYIIMTDSGGIQEEAPSLGKPVLVMRTTTERPEAVLAGTVKLVGTDIKLITSELQELLDDESVYKKMSFAHNPYGDGKASKRICEIIKAH